MDLSIVTTCMGRAAHLKQSMERFLCQAFADYIVYVVDWSSPDDLVPWLAGLDSPRVRVINVPGQKYFHLAAARNMGGKAACNNGVKHIAFIDADILIPDDFLAKNWIRIQSARKLHQDEFFLQSKKLEDSDTCIWGSCIVPAATWEQVQYNESIQSYGHEDNEIYSLWLEMGYKRLDLDTGGVEGIFHSDDERVRYYPEDAMGLKARKEKNISLFRGSRGNLIE